MTKFRAMLCGIAMVFAACADAPVVDEPTATEAEQVQTITRSIGPRTETCTITTGACRVGQCELGARDTVQRITEVCCDGGVCTTENYRLCGC